MVVVALETVVTTSVTEGVTTTSVMVVVAFETVVTISVIDGLVITISVTEDVVFVTEGVTVMSVIVVVEVEVPVVVVVVSMTGVTTTSDVVVVVVVEMVCWVYHQMRYCFKIVTMLLSSTHRCTSLISLTVKALD
jgi:hypothetical protein